MKSLHAASRMPMTTSEDRETGGVWRARLGSAACLCSVLTMLVSASCAFHSLRMAMPRSLPPSTSPCAPRQILEAVSLFMLHFFWRWMDRIRIILGPASKQARHCMGTPTQPKSKCLLAGNLPSAYNVSRHLHMQSHKVQESCMVR